MAVNYDDERFNQVNQETNKAIENVNNMYNNMQSQADKYYQGQIKAAEEYGNQQAQIQQANTDFAIEQINQQKEQAQKDYTREQKGAYVDWQKESNQYGVNAEQLASAGLSRTGYSESSQVSMYNTYQNRISQARDTYNRAVLDYDNGIREAQLTNNAKLAEIAYKSLQTKLELSLNGFQYQNKLLESQLAALNQERDRGYAKWQDVLKQINTENALKEQQRQFNISYSANKKAQQQQAKILKDQQKKNTVATIKGVGNAIAGIAKGIASNIGQNSDATKSKSDYYFSNGYQPSYVGNEKLNKSGYIVYDVFGGSDTTYTDKKDKTHPTPFGEQNIWKTSSGNYYIWDGSIKDYVNVSNKVKQWEKDGKNYNYTWGE